MALKMGFIRIPWPQPGQKGVAFDAGTKILFQCSCHWLNLLKAVKDLLGTDDFPVGLIDVKDVTQAAPFSPLRQPGPDSFPVPTISLNPLSYLSDGLLRKGPEGLQPEQPDLHSFLTQSSDRIKARPGGKPIGRRPFRLFQKITLGFNNRFLFSRIF